MQTKSIRATHLTFIHFRLRIGILKFFLTRGIPWYCSIQVFYVAGNDEITEKSSIATKHTAKLQISRAESIEQAINVSRSASLVLPEKILLVSKALIALGGPYSIYRGLFDEFSVIITLLDVLQYLTHSDSIQFPFPCQSFVNICSCRVQFARCTLDKKWYLCKSVACKTRIGAELRRKLGVWSKNYMEFAVYRFMLFVETHIYDCITISQNALNA